MAERFIKWEELTASLSLFSSPLLPFLPPSLLSFPNPSTSFFYDFSSIFLLLNFNYFELFQFTPLSLSLSLTLPPPHPPPPFNHPHPPYLVKTQLHTRHSTHLSNIRNVVHLFKIGWNLKHLEHVDQRDYQTTPTNMQSDGNL